MKKKHLGLISLICVACIILLMLFVRIGSSGSDTGIIEDAWGKLSYQIESDHTHIDVEMYRGSRLCVGRELWKSGDVVSFTITAQEGQSIQVGILPAEDLEKSPEYNTYGGFISEELKTNGSIQEVTITVPESGEYGIGIQHFPTQQDISEYQEIGKISTVSISFDINKVFSNPLAES